MKSKLFFLVIIIMALLSFSVLMAATHYDEDVTVVDRTGILIYKGTVTFADSASGAIYYTQAMLIGAVNATDGYARYICSEKGTEDVNVFYEYSMDGTNWYVGTTDANVDAVGTTAVLDTIGIVAGTNEFKFHSAAWYRIKFVAGQAIGSTTVTWVNSFKKPAGLERVNCGLAKNTQ